MYWSVDLGNDFENIDIFFSRDKIFTWFQNIRCYKNHPLAAESNQTYEIDGPSNYC